MKGYADLADVPENQRIRIIAAHVVDRSEKVAVAIDADEKKIARYIRKFHEARPGLIEVERRPGLVPNTVTLFVNPKPKQNVAQN